MRKMLVVGSVGVFLFFGWVQVVFAASAYTLLWSRVSLESNLGKLAIRLTPNLQAIRNFRVEIDGKAVRIDAVTYADIKNPDLSTLNIYRGCAPVCLEFVAFEFEKDVYGVSAGPHKGPEVTYVIENGELIERMVKRYVNAEDWHLEHVVYREDSESAQW